MIKKEELLKYTDEYGDVDLYGTDFIRLPDNLKVYRNLYLYGSKVDKLPENLTVFQNIDMKETNITKLPKSLRVYGTMYLSGTKITNYPVVYNCGRFDRAIYLDTEYKSIIHIGCTKGTQKQIIDRIKSEYSWKEAEEYISKVEECFDMHERLK